MRLIEGVSDKHILDAQDNLTIPCRQISDRWLEHGVKEGLYKTATITRQATGRDPEDVAVVFYSIAHPSTLVVNFAHSLRPDLDLTNCLELSFRRLAGSEGCVRVQFLTKRGGAIRKAIKMGYEICGVVIRRELKAGDVDRAQDLQQQMESDSTSKESTSANQTATNQQVGTSGPDSTAFGAGSSGDSSTVNISTTDEHDLEASLTAAQNISGTAIAGGTQVAGAAIASNTDVTNNALNAGVMGLKNASALAQSGLQTASDISGAAIASNAQTTGAAIASNTEIAGTSIAAADDELHQSLSANDAAISSAASLAGAATAGALNFAGSAQAGAFNLVDQLGGESIAATSNIAGAAIAGQLAANQNANQLVAGAVQAVVNGNANSNAALSSVTNSFTNALEESNQGANQLAAGALDQEQQVLGATQGAYIPPASSDIAETGQILQNVPKGVQLIIGLAVVGFVIYAIAKLKD